jgi:hypothetical protein
MADAATPPGSEGWAVECVLTHSAKSIEIEDVAGAVALFGDGPLGRRDDEELR